MSLILAGQRWAAQSTRTDWSPPLIQQWRTHGWAGFITGWHQAVQLGHYQTLAEFCLPCNRRCLGDVCFSLQNCITVSVVPSAGFRQAPLLNLAIFVPFKAKLSRNSVRLRTEQCHETKTECYGSWLFPEDFIPTISAETNMYLIPIKSVRNNYFISQRWKRSVKGGGILTHLIPQHARTHYFAGFKAASNLFPVSE